MKFSIPMILLLAFAALIIVMRMITPSPMQQVEQQQQQMLEQMNQQNQALHMQNLQMLNGMQPQTVNPYQTDYTMPGYYTNPGSPNSAYPNMPASSYPNPFPPGNGYNPNGPMNYADPNYANPGYTDPGYSNPDYATENTGDEGWNW